MEEQLDREIVTDCGEDAGLVLAGLRTGLRRLVFAGDRSMLARLDDIALQLGAEVIGGVDAPVLCLQPGEEPARAIETLPNRLAT
jgi:hypothetical protein